MCGKFTQLASWADLVAFSRSLAEPRTDEAELVASTPMMFANIMRLGADGGREMAPMRWGFADRNAKNPARPKHMHARAETVDTLPTFADSFAQRRGVLFVRTFNVGEELTNGRTKQWVISPKDDKPIAFAVIYEEWRNGEESLLTFVQVTTPANALLAQVTDRMPAVLLEADWEPWLRASPAEAKARLRTYEDGGGWDLRPQAPKPKPGRAQADLFG